MEEKEALLDDNAATAPPAEAAPYSEEPPSYATSAEGAPYPPAPQYHHHHQSPPPPSQQPPSPQYPYPSPAPAPYYPHQQQQQQQQQTTVVVAGGGCVQAPYPQTMVHVAPPDYFALSLFTLFCCCWPIGICALLSSIQARDRTAAGDFAGAHEASHSARNLNRIGIALGIVALVGTIIAVVVINVNAYN